MTDPSFSELFSVGTQAIQERAKSLGLTWGLRLATVDEVGTNMVNATYDGDDISIGMFSMIGTLSVGSRVFVMQVPPSGNFIVGQVRAYESGEESISFTTQTSFTVAVTFTNPFILIPRVFVNINSGAGSTSGWGSRAINVDTTGFTIFVFGTSSTWVDINVYWEATAR